jgi:sporulation protein YlmC with PRC-barrel domain
MRLSELLGREVVTVAGEHLGRVHDVLLVQDGPLQTNRTAALRLHALAVGRRSYGTRLGYAQGTVHGPWLFHKLLGSQPTIVPWHDVVAREAERIVVRWRVRS